MFGAEAKDHCSRFNINTIIKQKKKHRIRMHTTTDNEFTTERGINTQGNDKLNKTQVKN